MLTQTGEKGQPLLKKVAVLMTDGEYNQQYCNSTTPNTAGAMIPDYDTGTSGANCKSPNGTSTQQARSMCVAMKAAGITVYTVGFEVGEAGVGGGHAAGLRERAAYVLQHDDRRRAAQRLPAHCDLDRGADHLEVVAARTGRRPSHKRAQGTRRVPCLR